MVAAVSNEVLVERYLAQHLQVSLTKLVGNAATFRCSMHGRYSVQLPQPGEGTNRYIPRCADCGRANRVKAANKWSTQSLKQLVREKYGSRFGTSKIQYVGYKTHVTLTCKEHGDFPILINTLTTGVKEHLCSKCWDAHRRKNVSVERVQQQLVQQGLGYSLVSWPTPLRWNSFLTFECPTHGNWTARRGPASCPYCVRDYKCLIRGREFQVQGYERFVIPNILRWMKKTHGLTMRHLFEAKHPDQQKRPPRFDYCYQGRWHSYYPDFWIPDARTVIEVKSDYTAGLGRYAKINEKLRKVLRAKARAVAAAGYEFKLLVHERNRGIERTYECRTW